MNNLKKQYEKMQQKRNGETPINNSSKPFKAKKNTSLLIQELTVKKTELIFEFLLRELKGYSRNNIKSLLARNQIAVDGAPISYHAFEVHKGDVVGIYKSSIKALNQMKSKLNIIYEDDEFIVINKPSGQLSIATDKEKVNTAYHQVMEYIRYQNPKARIFITHRIDKETSGVLMFSKNQEIRDALQKNWNSFVKKREYIALCEGVFEKPSGSITSYLLETKTNIMYSSSHPGDGLKATTNYTVLKHNDKFSLVQVLIDSGRKNQIRVHMKDLGHQVVGDEKYQSTLDPLKRLGLHNHKLVFEHPNTKKIYTFVAKTPQCFTKCIEGATDLIDEEIISSKPIVNNNYRDKQSNRLNNRPNRKRK